jgi:AsmA protein
MKLLMKLLGVFFALILIVTVGVAIFALTFNPNDHKDFIIQKVAETTGRTLTLEQDLSLTVFPTLGVVINKASLSNPREGFKAANMISFDRAEIGVNVLPLLNKKIEISTINLDKAVINLEVNKQGKENWVFDTPQKEAAQVDATTPTEKAESFSLNDLSVGQLNVSNTVLNYSDAKSGQTVSLNPFNLSMKNLRNASDIPTQADFIFKDGKDMNLEASISSTINADMDTQLFALKKSDIKAKIKSKNAEPMSIEAKSDILAKLSTQEVSLDNLVLAVNSLNLQGNAAVKDFAKPAITFNLRSDELDLNPFMAKPDTTKQKDTKKSAAKETPIDLTFLKNLKLDGQFTTNMLKADKLALADFKADIGGPYGTLTLKDMSFKAFEGAFKGQGLVDARNAVPAFTFKSDIIKANVANIITTYMGDDFISGLMDAQLNISTQGKTNQALMNNLTGTTNFNLGQGVISKWALSKRLNQVLSFIKTGSLAETSDDEFKFTSAQATTNIANGIIRNEDLNVAGVGMDFLGKGFVNLAQQTVDYTLETKLGEGLLEKSSVRSVPIRISGPLSAPSYKIQMTDVVKDKINETISTKANEYLESEKGKALQEKLDKSLGEGATEQLKNILPF